MMKKKQLSLKAKAKESLQMSIDLYKYRPIKPMVHSMPHPPLLLGQLPADTMLSFLPLYLLADLLRFTVTTVTST